MSLSRPRRLPESPNPVPFRQAGCRQLYHALASERGDDVGRIDQMTWAASRSFLLRKLAETAQLDSDFPDDPRSLKGWLADANARSGLAYRDYLDERRRGAPRRFFGNRSHALHFLKTVAPTKLVDGAWLYGLLSLGGDSRLAPLVRIYLEELGNGVPSQNHVLLYRELLARHGCDDWQQLPDDRFVQGAIQLSLAHHAADFLPEIIGFNLGYEQLPLHLPITAHELHELDIDPYYFSLHVTIDNASTGHAQKSLQCALDALPRVGDSASFYRRIASGFRLNELGMGTKQAIACFDLEQQLLAMLTDKAAFGANLHSDYCRIAGRTVTDWLSEPGQLPRFLEALQASGWVRRGEEPTNSRFWLLMTDEKAPMFGVFSACEQQLIQDWIMGDRGSTAASGPVVNRFRRRPAVSRPADSSVRMSLPGAAGVADIIRLHLDFGDDAARSDVELQALRDRLAGIDTTAEALAALLGFLSPANHASPAGLVATRIYARLFGG